MERTGSRCIANLPTHSDPRHESSTTTTGGRHNDAARSGFSTTWSRCARSAHLLAAEDAHLFRKPTRFSNRWAFQSAAAIPSAQSALRSILYYYLKENPKKPGQTPNFFSMAGQSDPFVTHEYRKSKSPRRMGAATPPKEHIPPKPPQPFSPGTCATKYRQNSAVVYDAGDPIARSFCRARTRCGSRWPENPGLRRLKGKWIRVGRQTVGR